MTIRTWLIALPVMLLGWLVTLSTVALLSDRAPAYVVLFPNPGFVNGLPEGAAILAASRFSITVTLDRPEVAKALYAHGALIVLPAGLEGCLRLAKSAS